MPVHVVGGVHFPLVVLADPSDGTILEAVPVSAASLPLPTGAATGAKQDTGNAALASIDGKLANPLPVSGPLTDAQLRAAAVAMSAATLPLPTGAATETSLAAVLAKIIASPATEATLAAILAKIIAAPATEATLALIKAKTDNLDVLLSTRTKPADTQPISAAALPLPADAATQTTLAALNTKVTAVNTGAVVLAAGSAAVGKLAANSGVDIGDVDVTSLPALPAGTAKIGGAYSVGGQQIDEAGTVRAVSRAFANASLIGNTQVVAAQGSGVKIRVLSVLVVAALGVTVKFQSATTDISAGFPLGNNGGMVLPLNPSGWFETAANEALNLNLSLGTATGIQITWCPAT